ncbi:MAG: DNA2/NAM7 family helicase [Deltaproteobacteria bacterium]|nr:DNA2/NAM7 family helicase [Deltaproteobacteria bacterium]
MPDSKLARKSELVIEQVVGATLAGETQLVRVEAPPGAGKTRLIKRAIAAALEADTPMMVAVQTNAQLADLALGLAAELKRGRVGIWPSKKASAQFGTELAQAGQSKAVRVLQKTKEVQEPTVVVGVAAKWGHHASTRLRNQRIDRRFAVGIVDEAYQMPAGALFRFGRLMDSLALVGDPGQLDPFTEIETARWDGIEASAVTPGPKAVAALSGVEASTHVLPASLRLDERAASVVQQCFYPELPFRAVAVEGDRRLTLSAGDASTTDRALDVAAQHGWALLELPARFTLRDDPEVADALGHLAERLLARNANVRAQWPPELSEGAPLTADRIAVATAHRDQRDRVRERLSAGPAASAVVDTANRLQGREFDVVLVWHPLSGRAEASEFHLDTGRLCVMASRHRQACIVVSRGGVPDLLDDHQPSGQRPKGVTEDREHDGWIAHQRFFDALSEMRISR